MAPKNLADLRHPLTRAFANQFVASRNAAEAQLRAYLIYILALPSILVEDQRLFNSASVNRHADALKPAWLCLHAALVYLDECERCSGRGPGSLGSSQAYHLACVSLVSNIAFWLGPDLAGSRAILSLGTPLKMFRALWDLVTKTSLMCLNCATGGNKRESPFSRSVISAQSYSWRHVYAIVWCRTCPP